MNDLELYNDDSTHDIETLKALVAELGEEGLSPEELLIYRTVTATGALPDIDFYDNLAEHVDETTLKRLSTDVIRWVLWDEQSREDWQERESRGIRLLGVSDKTSGGASFRGASRVVHPLLAEAVNQFHARAITELWPPDGPVKTQVLGEITPEVNDQAERVKDYMNYLYTTAMPGAFEEEDQLLFRLPLSGSCFKKIYFNPIEQSLMSELVEPSDFIVPFTATNLRTAPRFTHRIRLHANDVKKLQANGYYVDRELTKPHNETYDYPKVKQEVDSSEGRANNMVTEDQRHTIYECYVDYDLPGFEDTHESGERTGIALPYIITVDRDNQRVLRIQRNWRPTDSLRKKRMCFTHYKFTPGFGFYGYGLLHLIGGIADSATGALRSLLDSAAFANMPGGFRSRDAKLKGGDLAIGPGEWKEVDSSAEELAKAFFKLPYQFDGEALYKLLGYLDERGQRFVGTTENMVGDANNSAPVGTTLALIEQGSKQFTAIHMRLHRAHQDEFKIAAELCAEYIPEEGYPYAIVGGQRQIMASDFDERIDVVPVSDPNIISSTQRIAQAQAVLDLGLKVPGKINMTEAVKDMLSAMRVANIDRIVIDDSQPDPLQQKMLELELATKEAQRDKIAAETMVRKIEGLYSALQSAIGVVSNPAIVPVADSIARSSGFEDADGGSIANAPVVAQPVQPMQTGTNPLTPVNPESPAIGMNEGIEQQGNQLQ